jgi:TonB-dependent SusC/RagA subfamily outer membrane receptor
MREFACVAALVLAVLGLGAQESSGAGTPVVDIGQVDVSAEAYSPISLAPAGSVSVVTADDIEKSGAANAADALATVPDLWLNRSGSGGAIATASIGGSTSNQVLVIVDGVRLNDSREGGADLARIPAGSIEKIEVLRGGASAVYGADAVGGVILVTTKKSGASRLSLSVENTAYPTAALQNGAKSFIDGQSVGLADLAFSAQAERASNAYSYDSGGSSNIRDNADFWNGAGNLSVGFPLAEGRLSVLAFGSYQDAGVPGQLGSLSPQAEQNDSSLHGSLGWSSDALAGGALVLDAQAHGGFSRLELIDPSYSENDRHDMTNGGFDIRALDSLTSAIDLGFGASILYEAANSTSFATNPDGQPTRLSLGAYLEPELRLGDRLKIKPALRYDWNGNFVAGLSAMLGAVWKASEAVDLRLSGGRSYRSPTFDELYWPSSIDGWGDIFGGNPDLKPEAAWSGELGVDARLGGLSLSASISARYIDDLIVDPYAASYNYIPYNIDAAFIPDASIEASYKLGPATLKANYEFLYPLDLSGGKAIADNSLLKNLSMHKAGGSADFAFGAAEAGVSASYWSDRNTSADGSGTTLKGALVLDLTAAYRLQKHLRFNVAVENLLDSGYQVNYDYPMPGLTLKAVVRLDL